MNIAQIGKSVAELVENFNQFMSNSKIQREIQEQR